MKKFFALIAIVLFGIVAMAQERTVNSTATTIKTDASFIQYNGVAADTWIEGTRDTIDFVFTNLNRESVGKLVLTVSLDTIAGNDSVYYSLYGFNDLATSGTSIATGGLLINESNDEFDIVKWYWTNATTYVDLSYRFYRLRVIQDDNNSYDGGASLNWIKFKEYFK